MSGITLEELLAARDSRALRQRQLLEAYPGCTLICLTVQLPGPVKRNADSLTVGGAGLAALLDKFGSVLRHGQVRDLKTGYEAYLAVPLPALLVKRICTETEDTHPLGRLMDIDVLCPGEKAPVPLGREELGLPPRECLLCGNPARFCMRNHTHTQEELLEKIDNLVNSFLES